MATERYPALPPMPEDYEPPRPVAPEEYLRRTEMLPGTYEYYAGMMYPRFYPPGSTRGGYPAMAGGTAAHAQLIVADARCPSISAIAAAVASTPRTGSFAPSRTSLSPMLYVPAGAQAPINEGWRTRS